MPQIRRDVGRAGVGATAQERFEESRLEDRELDVLNPVIDDLDPHRAFTLDPSEVLDGDLSRGCHRAPPISIDASLRSLSTRNASDQALKPRSESTICRSDRPIISQFLASAAAFALSIGPKQP